MVNKLNKTEYILRSLSKIKHKRWELFVVSRVLQVLNDPEIEFVCQQLVRRKGGHALTDMYFPQFGVHLEVDEPQHASLEQAESDRLRTRDIVDGTGHTVECIRVYQDGQHGTSQVGIADRDIYDVCNDVDKFIDNLRELKRASVDLGTFDRWNFESRYDSAIHLERGHIDIAHNVVLKTHREALKCFGYQGGEFQRSSWVLPKPNRDSFVWFPKLYENDEWQNDLKDHEKNIVVKRKGHVSATKSAVDEDLSKPDRNAIVFCHGTDALGATLYRYKGVFRIDRKKSNGQAGTIWKRISTRVELPSGNFGGG